MKKTIKHTKNKNSNKLTKIKNNKTKNHKNTPLYKNWSFIVFDSAPLSSYSHLLGKRETQIEENNYISTNQEIFIHIPTIETNHFIIINLLLKQTTQQEINFIHTTKGKTSVHTLTNYLPQFLIAGNNQEHTIILKSNIPAYFAIKTTIIKVSKIIKSHQENPSKNISIDSNFSSNMSQIEYQEEEEENEQENDFNDSQTIQSIMKNFQQVKPENMNLGSNYFVISNNTNQIVFIEKYDMKYAPMYDDIVYNAPPALDNTYTIDIPQTKILQDKYKVTNITVIQ